MKKVEIPRGQVLSDLCPSRSILTDVTSRWSILVLYVLSERTMRFAEIRRGIGGISEKMLSETLKRLENHGFLRRVAYPVVPPKVEYSLTPLGHELNDHIFPLLDWLQDNTHRITTHHSANDAKATEPSRQSA